MTSPNSVVAANSKTYRDTNLLTNKRLRGLFIIDKDNIVALIWDHSYKTNIANLNLATSSVTYKPTLPLIANMYTGVFVSASVYYTVSGDTKSFKDYTNNVILNGGKSQGIVYSSDMSLNSCYSL